MADKRGVLLLVWVHGFRGGDDTFASFPSRIVDTLASLRPNLAVKALVYPAYDTRGFLVDAVAHFVDWLVEQAVLAQTEHGVSPTLVLCAHSMGGMVIADAVAQLQRSPTPWPTILGVIAYDTPFRGLNPAVFKVRLALSECSELTSSQNKLEHAVGIASQGQAALSALGVGWGLLSAMKGQKATPTPSPPASSSKSKPAESTTVATNGAGPASTSWLGSYGIAAGAGVALAAVAGAAFYQKDVLSGHLSWATSHLSYVAELWKTDELEARLNRLEALDQKLSLDGADGEKRPRIKFHWCVSADQRACADEKGTALIWSTQLLHDSTAQREFELAHVHRAAPVALLHAEPQYAGKRRGAGARRHVRGQERRDLCAWQGHGAAAHALAGRGPRRGLRFRLRDRGFC